MKPKDVVSPKGRWTTIEVLVDGTDTGKGHSLVLGKWDDEPALGMRWDGDGKGVGNPQSRGLGVWFIVPRGILGAGRRHSRGPQAESPC